MIARSEHEPPADCPLCPRLIEFRAANRIAKPDWFNAPVPSFGDLAARLLIVGLAPGLRGANKTGRPFTGDFAGDLLYRTLIKFGFAKGEYAAHRNDGLRLIDCRITNAVRCVPPANKPLPAEERACRPFLRAEVAAMPRLRVLLSLGKISHDAVLTTFDIKPKSAAFAHGAAHDLPNGLRLIDSYHCSRQNTNTRRLTPAMFESVFAEIKKQL
ncbi:MAG: uracil-DNA glycosylase [Alphaproteobacteria bacterium]